MADTQALKQLALVTGASTGIGYELAKQFAEHGFDLLIAADEGGKLQEAAQSLRQTGAKVETCVADLATSEGVEQLIQAASALNQPIDVLAANAGRGLGHAFVDQKLEDILKVINTNVTGLVQLTHHVARQMVERGQGRILITSSIAALMPGSYQAIYNATKAFEHSFAFAIRNEMKDTGVTVTALMPGPTDTEFFDRAGLQDTKVGASDKKDDPADVAKTGFDALMRGEGDVIHGIKNKLQGAIAAITPQTMLAEMHRGMAEPGSAAS